MTRDIDLLTSPALTHLRDRWWDASFTAFVRDTLRPQPGEHVLEVGCGAGIADLMFGLLEPGSVRYRGIDIKPARVREARGAARDHGLRLDLAVADVRGIPFRDAVFECTFAIGVLQHVSDAPHAVAELARVTRPDGRVLLVEPDNANRYWFSSLESGRRAFELSTQFFASRARDTNRRRQERGTERSARENRSLPGAAPARALPCRRDRRDRHPSLPGDAHPPWRAHSDGLGRPPPRDRPRRRSRDEQRIPRARPRASSPRSIATPKKAPPRVRHSSRFRIRCSSLWSDTAAHEEEDPHCSHQQPHHPPPPPVSNARAPLLLWIKGQRFGDGCRGVAWVGRLRGVLRLGERAHRRDGVTSPSGAASRSVAAAGRSNSAAALAACCCRWRRPASRSSASIVPCRCSRAPARVFAVCARPSPHRSCAATSVTSRFRKPLGAGVGLAEREKHEKAEVGSQDQQADGFNLVIAPYGILQSLVRDPQSHRHAARRVARARAGRCVRPGSGA